MIIFLSLLFLCAYSFDLDIVHIGLWRGKLLPTDAFGKECQTNYNDSAAESPFCRNGISRAAAYYHSLTATNKMFLDLGYGSAPSLWYDRFNGSFVGDVFRASGIHTIGVEQGEVEMKFDDFREFAAVQGTIPQNDTLNTNGMGLSIISANIGCGNYSCDHFVNYRIFDVAGELVAITGVIFQGTINTNTAARYVLEGQPFETLRSVTANLMADGINKIIAYINIPFPNTYIDEVRKVTGLDLILCDGYVPVGNETFPSSVIMPGGAPLVILSPEYYGRDFSLGHVSLTFDSRGFITNFNGTLLSLDLDYPTHPPVEALISSHIADLIAFTTSEIAVFPNGLPHDPIDVCWDSQCYTGSFACDALEAYARSQDESVDFTMYNADAFQGPLPVGSVGLVDLDTMGPYGVTDLLIKFQVSGTKLREILEFAVAVYPSKDPSINAQRFPAISGGLRYEFNPNLNPGERVFDITVRGVKISPTATYTIVSNDYVLLGGGAGYGEVGFPSNVTVLSPYLTLTFREALLWYFTNVENLIDYQLDGRISLTSKTRDNDDDSSSSDSLSRTDIVWIVVGVVCGVFVCLLILLFCCFLLVVCVLFFFVLLIVVIAVVVVIVAVVASIAVGVGAAVFSSKRARKQYDLTVFDGYEGEDVQDGIKRLFRELLYADLTFDHKIGEGAYGRVFRGFWRENTIVAIKELNVTADERAKVEFVQEANIMAKLGTHPNVVRFIGAVTTQDRFYMVSEFAQNGSLHDLTQRRAELLTPQRTLLFAVDAASGVLHLHSEGVVHRDIACRNFLVSKDFTVMVTDFGLSRIVEAAEGSDAALRTRSDVGPVRWMAPESVSDREYSTRSDVYMFASFLLELFSREVPYGDMELKDVILASAAGESPPIPPQSHIPVTVADLMEECWKKNPVERPDMKRVYSVLRDYYVEQYGEDDDRFMRSSATPVSMSDTTSQRMTMPNYASMGPSAARDNYTSMSNKTDSVRDAYAVVGEVTEKKGKKGKKGRKASSSSEVEVTEENSSDDE